jgi:outer membrane protein assembly factor BamD
MSMSRPSSVFSQIRQGSVMRASKVLVMVGVCALALAACAGKPKKPDIVTQQRPVELIYATGAAKLDDRQWGDAVEYFHEVERQYPYSEWSRRAILMTAYAHYQANNYDDARGDADRFVSLYPGNASAVYAYYIKSICFFEQIIDVGRDQAATEQALAALREVVRRYPNTVYATDAKLKIDMVNDQLAGKEMTVGRYYLRNGQPLSAIGRFRQVIDKYQTTSDAPEAMYRLVEAYLTLGINDEAKRNAAVLGYNYPGDRWYADAYSLMQGHGLKPQIVPIRKKRPGGIRFPSLPFVHGKALKPPATA